MKKSIIAILMLMVMCTGAAAQDHVTAITYQPSFAVDELENYISDTSWIGWGIEGRTFRGPTSNFTLGFAFAWHVFDQRVTGTEELTSGAVTGTQRRYINSLPFLITGDYYFSRKGKIKPFVGVGAGAYYVVRRFDIGVWTSEDTKWSFGAMGEAGAQIPFDEVEFFVSARYYYAVDAVENLLDEKNDISYVSAVIGLAYTRW